MVKHGGNAVEAKAIELVFLSDVATRTKSPGNRQPPVVDTPGDQSADPKSPFRGLSGGAVLWYEMVYVMVRFLSTISRV